MRTVELALGIKSSVLGFGCAPVLGAVDAGTARRALTVALDEGITHFDLARSYGYGEAENFVGRFLQTRRSEVVFATKFGIVTKPAVKLLRPLKPMVRFFRGRFYKVDKRDGQVASISDRLHVRVPLCPVRLRISVEKSLRALRTDYLDYLFLHEPREQITEIDALVEEVSRLKLKGMIRAWGLAFMREKEYIHTSIMSRFDVLQYDLSPGAENYEKVKSCRAGHPNVFFSPFSQMTAGSPRSEVLQKLGRDFPRSVVLCSMFNPRHIRENIKSLNVIA